MNPLGQTIHQRRKELKLTLQQVADRAGCTKGYLSSLENDRRSTVPSSDLLRRLEGALHLEDGRLVMVGEWKATPSVVRARVRELEGQTRVARRLAEVLQREGVDRAFKSGELEKLVRSLDPDGGRAGSAGGSGSTGIQPRTAGSPWHGEGASGGGSGSGGGNMSMMGVLPMQVPVINKVAAGYPTAFTDLGYPARVADEYVSVPDVFDADAFAARVVGDSMEPVYREGDIVVFSPMTATVDGSDCFVRFERNEESTFKRVYFEATAPGAEPDPASVADASSRDEKKPAPMKRIRLQPLNPAYPARVVDREEVAGLYAAVYVVRAVGGNGKR
jgi:repressor LexA